MHDYQQRFIEFAIDCQALKFGEFTLKSGRVSPYFFNAGEFNRGRDLDLLGRFYADALAHSSIDYDVILGPAYKGIPLGTSLCVALSRDYDTDVPFVFNRKEAKTHGEGGTLVGAPLEGNVLIVDDVITAGTAIREVMDIIEQAPNARAQGVLIALDRQEKGQGDVSAIADVERTFGVTVASIVGLNHVLDFVSHRADFQSVAPKIAAYRDQYGVA